MARGPDGAVGAASDAVVRYYANADGDRVRMGNESRASGIVRVTLCSQCHRIFLHGLPTQLGTPAKYEIQSPAERAVEEPLTLARDATDGFNYLRVEQEGTISIIEVLAERISAPNESVFQRVGQEFTEALEMCHARTIVDLGHFVPTQHASAFVTTLIKLKKRWLERHLVPSESRAMADDTQRGLPHPTVKQLSFPVHRARPTAIAALAALPEGGCEMVLCGAPQSLVDVLKVTRLLRAPPV